MEVDEKLKEVLERLNGTSLGMVTSMSCQYDWGGYSSISFRPSEVLSLTYLMRRKHIEKYGAASTYAEESLYSAIAHNNGFIYYDMIGCGEKYEDLACGGKPYFLPSQSICTFKTQLFETDVWDDEKKEGGTALYYGTLMLIHPKLIDHFVLLWDKLFDEKNE